MENAMKHSAKLQKESLPPNSFQFLNFCRTERLGLILRKPKIEFKCFPALLSCCSFFFFLNFILFLNFTILYWFCQISTWIRHRYTCVPHPEPSSLLPPHSIPLGRPSAPAPSIQYRASNLDWRLVPYMILYVFQCHSPNSSHPLPLPQSPKDCSIHQCLFCCLLHRVIVTIFLNSIYMR